MSEAKHTPGPWRLVVRHYGEGREIEILGDSGKQIARMSPANHFDDYDAPLMATAPELLEQLKVAMSRINDLLEADDGQAHKEARKALPKMESAIAKATGQP